MKYSKEDSLNLMEVNISYLSADYEKNKCPKLIINEDILIVNFRGYYWTDMHLVGSNEGLVYNNSPIASDPILIVESILKGLNIYNISFTDEEITIIRKWYEDTIKFHSLII